MNRVAVAFSCFFKMLFGGKLPQSAALYLPEGDTLSTPQENDSAPRKAEAPKPPPRPTTSASNRAEDHRDGALAMLSLLQRKGRFVDFLNESIDNFSDADVGAVARDIHRGCRSVLRDHVAIEAVMPGEEDSAVKVPEGFDPGEIRLVGNVDGKAPFMGVLRHHGWRATKVTLPSLSKGVDRRVITPAEVEIQA